MVTAAQTAMCILGIIMILVGLYLIILALTYFLNPQEPYLASGVISMTGGIFILCMGAIVIKKVGWKIK